MFILLDTYRKRFNRNFLLKPILLTVTIGVAVSMMAQDTDPCDTGIDLYKSRKYSAAIPYLTKCYQQGDQDYAANFYLGLSYYKLKDYDKAVEYFKAAIRLKPMDYDPYAFLSKTYILQGKTKEAIETATKGTDIAPENPNAHMRRGWCHYKSSMFRAAIDDFDRVIVLEPDNALAFNNRASCRFNAQNIMDASDADKKMCLQDYQKALQLDSTLHNAWRNMGLLSGFMGKPGKGLEYIEKSKSLNPIDPLLYVYASKLYLMLDKPDEVIKIAREQDALLGKDYRMWMEEALAWQMKEAYSKSDALFLKVFRSGKKKAGDALYEYLKNAALQKNEDAAVSRIEMLYDFGYFKNIRKYYAFKKEKAFWYLKNNKAWKKWTNKINKQEKSVPEN